MANSKRYFSAHRALAIAMFALMLSAAAAVGFFLIYSHFSPDDEGYVMMSVRSFLGGDRLYDQVYSQYGPFYYLYKAALHRISGLPVTHDTVRLMTLGAWLLASLFCSLFSYRVTRSLLIAAAVFLFTFRSLWLLSIDPGHPQELCVLLLACGVYLSSFADSDRRRRWVLPGLGAIAAALVLTKINCGLYFCVALAGGMVSFAESRWFRHVAGSLLGVLAIFLPVCLMWSHLEDEHLQIYAAIAAFSCLSGVAVAMVRNGCDVTWLDFASALAGFVGSVLLVLTAMLACGSSAAGVWNGVVRGPLRFPGQFVMLAVLPFSGAVLAAAGAVAAIAYCLYLRGLIRLSDRVSNVLSAAGIVIRALLVVEVVAVLAITGKVSELFTFVTPWLWLTMPDLSHRQPTLTAAFGRTMVVLAAAVEMLYAYPVSAAQQATAIFLIVPATAICAHDIWLRWQSSPFRLPARVAFACTALGYILIALYWGSSCRSLGAEHRSLTPLNLPGAQWLRLRQDEVAVLRCVSINLRDNCETFISAPGIDSFYLWSGLKPPTDFNPGVWMMLLDDEQKHAIVDQLERHPRAWFVYDRKLFELWKHGYIGPHADDPLLRYCATHFEPMARVGEFDLCVPVGGTHPLLKEAANVNDLPPAILSQLIQIGLPSNASPNVIVQPLFSSEVDRRPELARVGIVDIANGKVLADSNDNSSRGMQVLDADLRPVKLPLPPGWYEDQRLESLRLIPYQEWLPPKDYDYSKVLAAFFDGQGKMIACLPVAMPLAHTAQ